MASENLMPYISSLVMDTKREFAPCRVAKKKGRLSLIHSDHYTKVLKLKDLQKKDDEGVDKLLELEKA